MAEPEIEVSVEETEIAVAAKDEGAKKRSVTALDNVMFRDHHSLKAPSSTLHFQKKQVHIYGNRNYQFLLQSDGDEVVAKIGKDGSIGLSGLRLSYSLVALLMTGFLLVFCLQLLLFLFLGLTVDIGLTSTEGFVSWGHFLGTLLSIPLFVYSLACSLALATAFVADAWGGHRFINHITEWKDTSTQWAAFIIFLGIPIMVAIGTLFAKKNNWWEITALTWFICIFVFYCVFSSFVVYYEVMGTLELVRRHPALSEVNDNNLLSVIKHAIITRQIERFSGVEKVKYVVDGHRVPGISSSFRAGGIESSKKKEKSRYTKITEWQKLQDWGVIKKIEPVRKYSMDEVRDVAPFVTSTTWSLEKLYCRSRNQKFVAVMNGPNKLTTDQVRSSLVCALLGNVIIVLFIAALFTWLDAGIGAVLFVSVMVLVMMGSSVVQTINLYKRFKETVESKKKDKASKKNVTADDEEIDEILYQVWQSYRINKITPTVVWTTFVLEIVIFYIWPMITLFFIGNYSIAILFSIMGFISLVRHYFNAPSILKELGCIDILDEKEAKDEHNPDAAALKEEDFREKSRLNFIIGKISHGRRRNVWIYVFFSIVGIFCLLFVAAYKGASLGAPDSVPETLPAVDFQYKSEHMLPYPTCRMGNGLAAPGMENTALLDYAYLSMIAYSDSKTDEEPQEGKSVVTGSTQEFLDIWFGVQDDGQSIAVNEVEVVKRYREDNSVTSAVEFKLICFSDPEDEDGTSELFCVLAIRGTNNGWDALSDAQLWSCAWLAQAVRAMMPFGSIWTPIFETLINMVSLLESERLQEVSYYKETVRFVQYLKGTESTPAGEGGNFTNLHVTGHSLGGGLAMITGAQTDTPAVGLSGPNNLLSRKTFDPEITKEQLNTLTFNIVPDKDPVPRIDDVAELYQRIHCTAPYSNFADCHTAGRSVCEILVKCGNKPNGDDPRSWKSRPALCLCHSVYKYDMPTSLTDGVTFDDYCTEVE